MAIMIPFRLSLLDIDDSLDVPEIKSNGMIICLGTRVPKDIQQHIMHFNIKKSPKILEKYYGKHWNRLLQLVDSTKRGGDVDEEDFEDSLFGNLTLDELMESEISTSKKRVSTILQKPIQLKKKVNYNFDIDFFPEDDMKTIKEKIELVTNIPYFKQHVFYETANTQFYENIGYDMKIDHDVYNTQLKQIDFSKVDTLLLGIPIDRYLYSSYDSAYIKLKERTTSLTYYTDIDPFGAFHVISIDSFFKQSDIKKSIMHLTKIDKEQYYLIYYSFVYKYFPTFTESVFIGYIKNEMDLPDTYPDLIPTKHTLTKKYKLESTILNNLSSLGKDVIQASEDIFKTKINKLAIRTNEIYSDEILNIRTIFNNIQIQSIKNLNFIETILTIQYKDIMVSKIDTVKSIQYSHSYSDKRSLFLSIFVVEESLDIFSFMNVFIHMTISSKGVITVYIQFPQTIILNKAQCIDLIIKKVNPVIQQLNQIQIAFNSMYRILPLQKNNFQYIDTSVSLIYNEIISFSELKDIFEIFVDADILRHKSSIEENEYLLHKGITSYSMNRLNTLYHDIQNHYSYLSDLQTKYTWVHLFSNKTIIIKYNVISTVFEINNITMDETKYIKNILYKMLLFYKKRLQPKKTDELSTNNINSLKHTDPKLFNFKAKSNYSRVCQKKFQPLLTSMEEIRKKKIKNAIKYWNFTKNKEEYYYCPYQKNKYIGFITDVHPNEYCLPCCKKIKKEDEKYKTCLKDGTYTKEAKKKDKSDIENRYILQYIADIGFEERITELPNSLQKILNEQVKQKLYIYGYLQHSFQNIQNMDMIYIFMDAMNMTLQEYIFMIVKYLRENENIFPFLLHGTIYEKFNTVQELCKKITHTFTQKKIIPIPTSINWNDLFIDIMYHYGVNIIIFEDVEKAFNKEKIELVIAPYQHSITSIMKNDKSILVFRENTSETMYHYPIYTIDRVKYFSDGVIENKIIQSSHPIHQTLLHILQLHFSESDQLYYKLLTLKNVMEFIQSQKAYTLRDLYIDATKCYAVGIMKDTTYIYISIVHSSLEMIDSSKYTFIYHPIQIKKYTLSPKSVFDFITQYNLFAYQKTFIMTDQETLRSQIRAYQKYNQIHYRTDINAYMFDIDDFNLICDPIHISSFIIYKKMVIGCMYGSLYTYFQPPITIRACLSIIQSNIKSIRKNIGCKNEKEIKQLLTRVFLCKAPLHHYILPSSIISELKGMELFFREFLYHPNTIHRQLTDSNNSTYLSKNRIKLFNASTYSRYIYRIFVYLFVHSMKLHQNRDIRVMLLKICKSLKLEQLLSIINKNTNIHSKKIYNSIMHTLQKKYNINEHILQEITLSSFNEFINLLNLNKSEIISNYKQSGNIIQTLLLNNDFMFDMIHVEEIKHLSFETLKKKIDMYMNKHMRFTESTNQSYKAELHEEEFIQPKSSNMFYTKKKLNISKSKYNELVAILAHDITNPFKQKYILSNLFFDSPLVNTIYFKQFENEKIFINYL